MALLSTPQIYTALNTFYYQMRINVINSLGILGRSGQAVSDVRPGQFIMSAGREDILPIAILPNDQSAPQFDQH